LRFDLPNRKEEYNNVAKLDSFDAGQYGVVREKSFKFFVITNKFLDFLDFLHKLFNKKNYWGDIRIILEVFGIKGWKCPYDGMEFRHDQVYPFKSVFNLEELKNNQFSVFKTMFNHLFNGFGWLDDRKEEIIERMKFERQSQ